MPSVKLNLSALGKVKLALHVFQALMSFVALFVFIAMATKEGDSKGAGIYYCVMTLLTIPALIYLGAVPMWKRTEKFANVFAFMAIDSVFAILWLAAWAALVAWVRQGVASGADEKKIDHKQANCTTFDPKFGTEAKCDLGNACVGLGVTLFVAFIPTAVISYIFFSKIRKEPQIPQPWLGVQTHKGGEYEPADPEAGKDGAWSTEMHDDTGYGGSGGAYDAPPPTTGGNKEDDEYALLHGAGAHGHGPAGNEYGPSAGHQYSLSAEDRLHDRLDDEIGGYHGGSSSDVYGHDVYGHDDRTDTNLPPYPATPYGAHVEPSYGGHDTSYGGPPPPDPYSGAERPYSDRR